VSRIDVEFPGHGGTRLRGWLYGAGRGKPGPCVVMAHGFSATKEMALDRYAEVFEKAGLVVLVYDHRNLGASDGEPRQRINPWAQARDYRRAIDWLSARPEVDAARIGVWGSSFSGGIVLVLGACDERVAAVVANVPFAGLPGVDYADTSERFARLRAALLDESGSGPADAADDVVGPVAVVEEAGNELPVFLPQPESREWFLRMGAPPDARWRNQVTLAGMSAGWDPGVCVEHIAPTPLLMVVATEDRLAETEIARASFARAREPKRLEMVEGHHFVPYDPPAFEQAAGAARDFFALHLGP
jgi:alpha-beta hydrolase superfamily lysophospholipase